MYGLHLVPPAARPWQRYRPPAQPYGGGRMAEAVADLAGAEDDGTSGRGVTSASAKQGSRRYVLAAQLMGNAEAFPRFDSGPGSASTLLPSVMSISLDDHRYSSPRLPCVPLRLVTVAPE